MPGSLDFAAIILLALLPVSEQKQERRSHHRGNQGHDYQNSKKRRRENAQVKTNIEDNQFNWPSRPGQRAPRSDGPSASPARISPITHCCPIRLQRWPKICTTIEMTMSWRSI